VAAVGDPLEALLAYLGQDADLRTLIGSRLAARHRYGLVTGGWGQGGESGLTGLAVTPVPGEAPDLDAGMQRMRGDARAYAGTPAKAGAVVNRLRALCSDFTRCRVMTPSGEIALLYWLVPDDSPEHGFDTDLKMDFVRLPLRWSTADLEE
jgi:hypothetical protein